MTAILKELRLLEAEHKGGRLSDAALAIRKAALMEDIPDALETSAPERRPRNTATLDLLLILISLSMLCGAIVLFVTEDVFMAVTCGITILAALTIRLFMTLEP